MYSFFLLSHIASSTCTTVASATVIDNIFTNICNSPYTSDNFIITLSDHHAQFLIMKNQHNLSESKKEDNLCRDFKERKKKTKL